MPSPSGSLSVDNPTPSIGDLVTLTLDSYNNGGNSVDHWRILWGDGGTDTGSGDPSLGVLGTHTYTSGEGVIPIELDIFYVGSITTPHFVAITTVTLPTPTGTITALPSPLAIGDTLTVTLTALDLVGLTGTGWTLSWGDGNTDFHFGEGVPSLGVLATHSYTANGDYTVGLSIFISEFSSLALVGTAPVTVEDAPPPPVVVGCPTVELRVPADADPVVFDCATVDGSDNIWGWTKLDGWYEPPALSRSTVKLGADRGETVTKSDWLPRQITLTAQARVDAGSLNAALDELTALTDMLVVPGRITVNDAEPKYATVLLSDKPADPQVIGDSKLLEVQIPMVAYDVYRYRVADDVPFL